MGFKGSFGEKYQFSGNIFKTIFHGLLSIFSSSIIKIDWKFGFLKYGNVLGGTFWRRVGLEILTIIWEL